MEFAGVDKAARYGKGGQCGRNNTVTKAAYKISSLEVENDSLYI